ncbi:MAG: glucosamine-6-phosphate deaminase [Actinomycetota bacterium]|nr:glucosamine-6-phosphate deaminase [Actinomycetota bacterium]
MAGTEPLATETVDKLTVKVFEDREALGDSAGADAAEAIRELLGRKERVRVVFAAAPSQSETLAALARAEGIDWSRVTALHMDEYLGLETGAPQSFGAFLRNNLFDAVEPGEVHFIDGRSNADEESRRYASLLEDAPVDVVCLGIGENGHLAFNDPPVADFEDPLLVKTVELDQASRQQQVNDGMFAGIEDVPTHAITLTVPALLSGARLFCVVPGETKREAVNRALRGPVTTECPASVLRRHPDSVLYLDVDSYDKTF